MNVHTLTQRQLVRTPIEEVFAFFSRPENLERLTPKTLGTLVANLGYDRLIHPKPVFIGDTMRAESQITDLKDSKSRPGTGIVTFTHCLINQRDQIVCQCLRSALLHRTPK